LGSAGSVDGKTIYGGAGYDTLTLTLNDDDNGAAFTASGLEAIAARVNSQATASVAIDLSDVTDLEKFTASRIADASTTTADFVVNNIQSTDVVLVLDRIANDGISVQFDFDNGVVTGTADEANLVVNAVTATSTTAVVILDAGIEVINLEAQGTGNALSISATGATAVNISGTGDITLSTLSAAIVSVDASDNEGGVDVTFGTATTSVAATGGAGDDTIDVSAVTATGITVDGGAGDDSVVVAGGQVVDGLSFTGGDGDDTLTVSLTAAATTVAAATTTTTGAIVDGVETIILDLGTAVTAATVDLGAFQDISGVTTIGVNMDIVGGTAAAVDLSGVDGQSIEINLSGAATATTTVTGAVLTLTVGATTTTTSTADELSVAISNDATATTASGDDGVVDAAVNLTIAGVETINLSGDSAAGGLAVTLTATALETLNIDAAADMTVSVTSATAIADVILTGAGDVTLNVGVADLDVDASEMTGGLTYAVNTAATAAEVIVITGGAGDDSVTVEAGRYTVDLGAGDDTLTLGTAAVADLTSRDSFNGGDGTDTVEVTLAAGSNDLNLVGFEVLSLAATSTSATATIDRLTAVTAIEVSATSATVSVADLAVASIDLDVTALDGASSLSIALLDDTDTDVAALIIADGSATTMSVGSITLDDFDEISLDISVTNSATTATTTVAAVNVNVVSISSDSALSLVITGDDDGLATSTAMSVDLADGAAIDLTGVGSGNVGTAAVGTSSSVVTAITTTAIAGGIAFNGTENITLELADGRGGFDVFTVIDLGTGNNGLDAINFNNSSADADDEIGTVIISNFLDRTNNSVSKATVIDLSEFEVSGFSDLNVTGSTDCIITSDNFVGAIVLVGVDAADLTAGNFVFSS
jgi:S-layer protein